MMRDSVVVQSLHQDLKPFSKGRHKGGCQEAATSLRSSSSCPCSDFGDGQTRQNRFIMVHQTQATQVSKCANSRLTCSSVLPFRLSDHHDVSCCVTTPHYGRNVMKMFCRTSHIPHKHTKITPWNPLLEMLEIMKQLSFM